MKKQLGMLGRPLYSTSSVAITNTAIISAIKVRFSIHASARIFGKTKKLYDVPINKTAINFKNYGV